MKFISWNVNGIRAVERKGELQKFLDATPADVYCFQETKAKEEQLKPFATKYSDFKQYYHEAEKPGYAGTGIWVKKKFPEHVILKGSEKVNDDEGRLVRLDFEDYTLFNLYFPNGGKSDEAWQGKLKFYKQFLKLINKLREEGRKIIWTGDVNCAHNEIDLTRAKENDGNIGFHPKERAWLDQVEKDGWVDVFRNKYPDKVIYSYWDMFTRARDRNVGWRIDYFFLDKAILKDVKKIDYLNDQMGSDHCPVLLEIKI